MALKIVKYYTTIRWYESDIIIHSTHLLSASTVLGTLHILSCLIFKTTLWNRYHYYFYFIDNNKKIERLNDFPKVKVSGGVQNQSWPVGAQNQGLCSPVPLFMIHCPGMIMTVKIGCQWWSWLLKIIISFRKLGPKRSWTLDKLTQATDSWSS